MSGRAGLLARSRLPGAAAVRAAPFLAAGLSLVLVSAVSAVVVLQEDPAEASTVLAEARGVSLVGPGGEVSPGAAGADVPDDTAVRVATDGLAVLTTRSAGRTRQVVLGPRALYRVVDGVTGVLLRGDAVVDRRSGPRLAVRAGATRVAVRDDSVVRLDRRYALRVAAYRGEAALRAGGGRRSTLSGLEQLVQSGRALPASGTPLTLRGDELDRRADTALVRDDETLTALASDLDASGKADRLVRLTPASFLAGGPAAAPSEAGSETALPRALARAGGTDADEAERYAMARGVRAAGGAWAVAARTVEADVAEVPGAVAELLSPVVLAGAGGGAPLAPGAAGPTGAASGTGDGDAPGAAGAGSGVAPVSGSGGRGGSGTGSGTGGGPGSGSPGGDDDPSGPPRPTPTASPGPGPTPGPGPSPGPSPTPEPGPTDDPVAFVLRQLPPTPPTPPPPTPPAPVPTASTVRLPG